LKKQIWKLGKGRFAKTSSSLLRRGYPLTKRTFQVLKIALILNYFKLKLKMLVKEVRLYQGKGSVGFAGKKGIPKELA
jgi:hypothetical protein